MVLMNVSKQKGTSHAINSGSIIFTKYLFLALASLKWMHWNISKEKYETKNGITVTCFILNNKIPLTLTYSISLKYKTSLS